MTTRYLRAAAPWLLLLVALATWPVPVAAGVKVTLVRWPYT